MVGGRWYYYDNKEISGIWMGVRHQINLQNINNPNVNVNNNNLVSDDNHNLGIVNNNRKDN